MTEEGEGWTRGRERGCGLERGWVWGTCSWRPGRGEQRLGRAGEWRWRGWEVGKVERVWSKEREKQRAERGLLGQSEAEKKTAVES